MLQVDLLSQIARLRNTFGFNESNYKKYRSQLSAQLPNLRKIVAPHHRNQSAPFFYKTGDTMVIFSEKLLELIAVEAERSIATANEMNLIAQDTGALKHRRRVNNRYNRAIERYQTLYALSKSHATPFTQLQSYALLNSTIGINHQENDEFFDAVEAFQRASSAISLSQLDEGVRSYLLLDINSRLEHCEYMASVFADGDQAVIQQIKQSKIDCHNEVSQVQSGQAQHLDDIYSIYDNSIVIPKGSVRKVILKAFKQHQNILNSNIQQSIDIIKNFYLQHSNTSDGFYLQPFFYLSPSKPFPNEIKISFKKVTVYLKCLSDLINITKQYSERPRPFDPQNLQNLLFTLNSIREPILIQYNNIISLHFSLSLVSRQFSFQKYKIKRTNGAIQNAVFTIFSLKQLIQNKIKVQTGIEGLLNQSVFLINNLQISADTVEQAIYNILTKDNVIKGLLMASQIKQIRKDIKYLDNNKDIYRLVCPMPNPVFFDAVPEILDADDCLWGII
ncbi:Signal recognition particle [Spironucleus salmonicida]|uniref:Signal recognition particle subunit SRP68 n=1 Tax=Spironucleus salmonicida TaxID=348837 RepID=V6M722_9EUKA|nr:Signal recognition particle [Spironucleus salmonicida]|eukprot:EST49214.1 hypothetical protein SS50377_10433 [Spironucleus salmonicida]